MAMFCKIGIHKYKLIKGTHNKYYECARCDKRKVKVPISGYQPIDSKWLKENERK